MAGSRALGRLGVDQTGHLWTIWHASREALTTSALIGYPDGIDLLPILGGWTDILLASWIEPWIGLIPAFNAVTALYLTVAGIGGSLLARSLGAGAFGAFIAGTLLQVDSYLLFHLNNGRTEQLAIGLVALAIVALDRLARRPGREPHA